MISRTTIEEVRERASLAEVVGESVALKRQGSSVVGLCPFHAEKSPSFHIRDDRFYHCFGCGASGNAISFLMERRGLSFVEAVEELALRYGITVKREGGGQSPPQKDHRQELLKINRIAGQYFRQKLLDAPPTVHRYIQERGLTQEAISDYGVGFAASDRNGIRLHLGNSGFSDELIAEAGLIRRSASGEWYDTFRDRLIFPVWTDQTRIAGFGGRIIPALLHPDQKASVPKYINSPETPLYQKSKTLFGVPQALDAIRGHGEVYLVEGYMDVLGLWQAGVQQVLATCGTAVTERHVERLARMSKRVWILFDADAAGRNAAAKSIQVFLNSGIEVAAVFLPDGEDPDTMALKHGSSTAEILSKLPRVPLLECFLSSLFRTYGGEDARTLAPALRGRIAEEVARLLAKVSNAVEQHAMTQTAAMHLLVPAEEILSMARKSEEKLARKAPVQPAGDEAVEMSNRRDETIPHPVEHLPLLDREVLSIVMALKEEVMGVILHDPDLCQALDPRTLLFLGEMELLYRTYAEPSDRKEQVKIALRTRGESWIKHWKRAHEMAKDPLVNLKTALAECQRTAKKIKLSNSLGVLTNQLSKVEQSEQASIAREISRLSLQLRENPIR